MLGDRGTGQGAGNSVFSWTHYTLYIIQLYTIPSLAEIAFKFYIAVTQAFVAPECGKYKTEHSRAVKEISKAGYVKWSIV